mmetsp:Transcript_41917/g.115640  ORF Transcript_41917/g.115640 Transcript_41917/m.115640 type:complete len:85 (+) Transcript_41917:1-255(+)|eukprot:3761541-Prymnesium_polylepis.1
MGGAQTVVAEMVKGVGATATAVGASEVGVVAAVVAPWVATTEGITVAAPVEGTEAAVEDRRVEEDAGDAMAVATQVVELTAVDK